MPESEIEQLQYEFEWTSFEFYPASCSTIRSRLPRIVFTPIARERSIRFPNGREASRITLTSFPANSLNGERVLSWWERNFGRQTWSWPSRNAGFPEQGFYWMDVVFEDAPRYMGWLDLEASTVSGVNNNRASLGGPENVGYMARLRNYAFQMSKGQEPDSPGQAFYHRRIEAHDECKPRMTTRAYLVDWALAERRTGLSFPSMDAFEEWAAQQGLTVIAVADAPGGGGDERERESEDESEGEE